MGLCLKDNDSLVMYDWMLLWLIFGLVVIGFIMVILVLMLVGQCLVNDFFFFVKCDGLYIVLVFVLVMIMLCLLMDFWQCYSIVMLIVLIVMLLIVLVVGSLVNGVLCWIVFGLLCIQLVEFIKLLLFCYIVNYLVCKVDEVCNNLCGFLKLMGVIFVLVILLLVQFDFGIVVVLFVIMLVMLFFVGVKLWQFIVIIGMGILVVVLLIFVELYCICCVIFFWNLWEDLFGSGYQLIQLLMVFGCGEMWGQGFGNLV